MSNGLVPLVDQILEAIFVTPLPCGQLASVIERRRSAVEVVMLHNPVCVFDRAVEKPEERIGVVNLQRPASPASSDDSPGWRGKAGSRA